MSYAICVAVLHQTTGKIVQLVEVTIDLLAELKPQTLVALTSLVHGSSSIAVDGAPSAIRASSSDAVGGHRGEDSHVNPLLGMAHLILFLEHKFVGGSEGEIW